MSVKYHCDLCNKDVDQKSDYQTLRIGHINVHGYEMETYTIEGCKKCLISLLGQIKILTKDTWQEGLIE